MEEKESYQWIWYVVGVAFFIIAFVYLFKANDFLDGSAKMLDSEYKGMYKAYVGGDAYNYTIAGTYSTTLTLRALFFAFLGGVSFFMGKK